MSGVTHSFGIRHQATQQSKLERAFAASSMPTHLEPTSMTWSGAKSLTMTILKVLKPEHGFSIDRDRQVQIVLACIWYYPAVPT